MANFREWRRVSSPCSQRGVPGNVTGEQVVHHRKRDVRRVPFILLLGSSDVRVCAIGSAPSGKRPRVSVRRIFAARRGENHTVHAIHYVPSPRDRKTSRLFWRNLWRLFVGIQAGKLRSRRCAAGPCLANRPVASSCFTCSWLAPVRLKQLRCLEASFQ